MATLCCAELAAVGKRRPEHWAAGRAAVLRYAVWCGAPRTTGTGHFLQLRLDLLQTLRDHAAQDHPDGMCFGWRLPTRWNLRERSAGRPLHVPAVAGLHPRRLWLGGGHLRAPRLPERSLRPSDKLQLPAHSHPGPLWGAEHLHLPARVPQHRRHLTVPGYSVWRRCDHRRLWRAVRRRQHT
jgi:hypothetical protein